MLSLLRIYASMLSLVWLLHSVSLFSPVLCCVLSSPPTPSAIHRYCNGDFAWVRFSHHLPCYGSNGGVRRSFCSILRSEGFLFQALLHHRLPFPVMQSKFYLRSIDSGEVFVSQQQIPWSRNCLMLPFEVTSSLLRIPWINVGSVIAGPIGFRIEDTEMLMSVSNTSSDPSSRCSVPICLVLICSKTEKASPTQISPNLSASLPGLKKLSLAPATVRVPLSHRSALSRSIWGWRISDLRIHSAPLLPSSWLNSSERYRKSPISLFKLGTGPRKVMCLGPPEMLTFIPEELFTSCSCLFNAKLVQVTHNASSLLEESLVSSEVTKLSMGDSNKRSEPASSICSRVVVNFVRLCSFWPKSEKSISDSSPVISSLVFCSESLYPYNHNEACNLSRCSTHQDRYTFITPIVPNINCKFIEDFGALHELNFVMVNVYQSSDFWIRRGTLSCDYSCLHAPTCRVKYNLCSPFVLNLASKLFLGNFGTSFSGSDPRGSGTDSIALCYCRKDPNMDRSCHRHCTVCVLGIVAKYKHTDLFNALSKEPKSLEVHWRPWERRVKNGLVLDIFNRVGLHLPLRHSELIGVVVFIVACSIFVVVSSDRLKTRFSKHLFVMIG